MLLSHGFGREAITDAVGACDDSRLSIVRMPGSDSPACTALATRAKSTGFGASTSGAPSAGAALVAAAATARDGSGVRAVPLPSSSVLSDATGASTASAAAGASVAASALSAAATAAPGGAAAARAVAALALNACSCARHVFSKVSVSSVAPLLASTHVQM